MTELVRTVELATREEIAEVELGLVVGAVGDLEYEVNDSLSSLVNAPRLLLDILFTRDAELWLEFKVVKGYPLA